MGHPPGGDAAQARVPGLTLRRVLGGFPPLRQGEGPQCSLPACLALAAKADYDWLMAASGAAFTMTADLARWDPLAASPRDAGTRERAAAAAGVRIDEVAPPYDDELRALVLDRIRETIDAGSPVVVRGIAGPPEYGLLVGYDGDALLARTYVDRGPEPTRVGAEALASEDAGTPLFLDPTEPPDRARALAAGLDAALAAADATDQVLREWAAALRDEGRWGDARHAGAAAYGDHAMRGILADRRRAGARALRALRSDLPLRAQGDALRAAESYARSAELAEKHGAGPFDGAAAARFLDPGGRRGWANLLERIGQGESEGRAALASVRAAL